MNSLVNFYKKIKLDKYINWLAVFTLFFGLIAGVAMYYQAAASGNVRGTAWATVGTTHHGVALATLLLSALLSLGAIAYAISKTMISSLNKWRETVAGEFTVLTILLLSTITVLVMMSVSLALH